jgi:type IV pilus assembly protein PilB
VDRPAPFARSSCARLPGRRLGQLLIEDGLVTAGQLDEAVTRQRASGERLGAVLVRLGFLAEDQLVTALSRQYGLPALVLSQLDVDPEVLRLVPVQIARKYQVLPLERAGGTLTLAMADPTDVNAVADVAFMTNLKVMPVVAAPGLIRQAVERLGDAEGGAFASAVTEAGRSLDSDVDGMRSEEERWGRRDVFELTDSADEAPVVRLLNLLLADAIRRGASDIHFEPYEKVFRVRFRVDGVLHEIMTPPKRLEAALTSRMKIMASLDIAERRLPQDGRIKLRYEAREIDFRVSTLPTSFGEKTVIRILDKASLPLDLGQLGFDPGGLEQFLRAIHQPYGMILITGPTGSGKTTTLYSAINTLNRPDINIMTAEDPVEYSLKGINQVQVNEEIGRTFAAALRAFLRQDPDVILVGETRDVETAQIGIRAALTGHLVLTTVHTNDCPSTVGRLLDMGIAPFLVASSLSLILAQRLGRRICRECKQPYEVGEDSLEPYGYQTTGAGCITLAKGTGCAVCSFTGMKGRVAVYEVMPINDGLRDLILHNAPTAEIRDLALRHGMKTLRQNALALTLQQVTTLDEVLRITIA